MHSKIEEKLKKTKALKLMLIRILGSLKEILGKVRTFNCLECLTVMEKTVI